MPNSDVPPLTSNQQFNKLYIKTEFDEFSDKTTISHKNFAIVGGLYNLQVLIKPVLMKSPNTDLLVLSAAFKKRDWFFARNGDVVFNCDQDNIKIKFSEIGTEVSRDATDKSYCFESGIYVLSKELLKKICDAEILKIRFSGDKDIFDPSEFECQSIQRNFRQFYNNVFDPSLYENDLTEPTPTPVINSGGCFIATAAMGSYEDRYVQILSKFRDAVLIKSNFGKNFINFYYLISPPIANWMRDKLIICKTIKSLLIIPIAKFIEMFFLNNIKNNR